MKLYLVFRLRIPCVHAVKCSIFNSFRSCSLRLVLPFMTIARLAATYGAIRGAMETYGKSSSPNSLRYSHFRYTYDDQMKKSLKSYGFKLFVLRKSNPVERKKPSPKLIGKGYRLWCGIVLTSNESVSTDSLVREFPETLYYSIILS